jgi:hypothetical protein
VETATWVTAASGLVGALIGASAALVGQLLDAGRRARAAQQDELKSAIEEVLVQAGAVDMRGHEMMLLAANAGSLNGLISRMLGSFAPPDIAQVFETLNGEGKALQRAAARVWLMGDRQTVALTNAVVLAAAEVVAAHHEPATSRWRSEALIAATGRHTRDVARVADARRALAKSRRALAEHARQVLDLPEIDLFAVPLTAV